MHKQPRHHVLLSDYHSLESMDVHFNFAYWFNLDSFRRYYWIDFGSNLAMNQWHAMLWFWPKVPSCLSLLLVVLHISWGFCHSFSCFDVESHLWLLIRGRLLFRFERFTERIVAGMPSAVSFGGFLCKRFKSITNINFHSLIAVFGWKLCVLEKTPSMIAFHLVR